MLTVALAVALALPTPLTPMEQQRFRCVATLAIVADVQRRRAGWQDLPEVATEGARYAGIVGDEAAAVAGRSPELVANWLTASVVAVRRERLDRSRIEQCRGEARAVLAADAAQ